MLKDDIVEIMMPKLTVLIPCKNERMNIRPCIDSAGLVADEILVADSGSTDATMRIVREMGGCRLIEREFVNYADFKNWAIPQASHPWVLVLDADERITPELADEVRSAIGNAPDDVDGFWVPRRTFFMGHELRYSGWDTDALLRLFRRDRCRYRKCRVHEEIVFDRQRTRRLKSRMLHYTYWSYDQYFEKYLRYTKWGAEDLWDRGRRTSPVSLLLRPWLRFLQLYILRRGFLDGMVGIQSCMLQAFFVTFVKQGRLWEMEFALPQPDPESSPRRESRKAA
jgi:glycosyltransferase involved in cell wall biosynthesis